MRNRRAASAAFTIVVLGSSWAGADTARLRFEWTAPEACRTRDVVLTRVADLLGHALDAGLESELEVDARVTERSDASWLLQLRSRNEGGQPTERYVAAASCDELADAAALLLALAIDPALAERVQPSSSAFQPEQPPDAVPAPLESRRPLEPPQPPASPPAPTSDAPAGVRPAPVSPPLRLRVGSAFAVWSRRLPGLAPGALVHAGISRSAGWLSVTLGAFPARRASVDASPAGGDLSLYSSGAEVGYAVVLAPRVELAPLVGVEVDWVRGAGAGIVHPQHADLLLLGLGGGARAALRLAPSWAIFGQGLFSGLVTRPRFVLDGVGELYRPSAWGVRFQVGAEWRQP